MANINFLNTDNCDAITFNTPTAGLQYIEYILEDPGKDYTNVDKYTITPSTNCCTGTAIDIAPPYQFNPVITACASGSVFGVPSGTYTIQLNGIHGNLIQSFFVSINASASIVWPYVNTAGVVTFEIPLGDTLALGTIVITLTTTSGFVYTIEFDITQDPNPAISCDGVLSNLNITYPSLPSTIVEAVTALPNRELEFNTLFGLATVIPGVYQIIFCEILYDATSTCIQNHIFIDCGTLKCNVVNKLVLCIESNVMDLYNALIWGNDCTDTITYTEFCGLYEMLITILESDNCYGQLDDCNCTDVSTKANKLNPVSYPSSGSSGSNPCGC